MSDTMLKDPTIDMGFYCCYCGFNMTNAGICFDCNEYKSAVTLLEYIQMNGKLPVYKGDK